MLRVLCALVLSLSCHHVAGRRVVTKQDQLIKQVGSGMLAYDFAADANLTENATEDSEGPSYKVDMLRLKKSGYQAMFCGLSEDGCRTLDGYPGSGTHSELTWEGIVEQLQQVPARQDRGEIVRGNELGYLMLSERLWERDLGTIGLGLTVEDHAWVRPLFDKVVGSGAEGDDKVWSANKVKAALTEFFAKNVISSSSDVSGWAAKLNHKFHFDMDLDDELVKDFILLQTSAVPASLDMPGFVQTLALGITAAQDKRDEWLDRYRTAIAAEVQNRGLLKKEGIDEPDRVTLLASSFMDSLIFAGGLSVPGIINVGISLLYSSNSPFKGELTESNAEQFAFEVLRRYPGVVGFPWWSFDYKQHIYMNIAMALRDPRSWGEDSLEFTLRPVETYKKLARVAWAEPGNGPDAWKVEDPGRTGNLLPSSRGCPGQALSMAMLKEFFTAFASKQKDYAVLEAPKGGITFTDATPFAPTISLARVIRKGEVGEMSYSNGFWPFGSGWDSETTEQTMMLLAGDDSRPAQLHWSKDGKLSQDDPSAREVIVLEKGTTVTKVNDDAARNIAKVEGKRCFAVTDANSDEHRFCEASDDMFNAIEGVLRA